MHTNPIKIAQRTYSKDLCKKAETHFQRNNRPHSKKIIIVRGTRPTHQERNNPNHIISFKQTKSTIGTIGAFNSPWLDDIFLTLLQKGGKKQLQKAIQSLLWMKIYEGYMKDTWRMYTCIKVRASSRRYKIDTKLLYSVDGGESFTIVTQQKFESLK